MDENTREYYRQTWGFDPVTEVKILPRGEKRYRAEFPLTEDPPLHAVGVAIAAEVDFLGSDVHNRIVFRTGDKETKVHCTHTVVYSGTLEGALTFAADINLGYPSREEKAIIQSYGKATLSPEEHFVSLKSYVASIAETGLGNILLNDWDSNAQDARNITFQPFGFNGLMRAQVISALNKVAPDATLAFLREHIAVLADSRGANWLVSQLPSLDQVYFIPALPDDEYFEHSLKGGLSDAIFNCLLADESYFEALYEANPGIAMKRLALQWAFTPSGILEYLVKRGPETDWDEPMGRHYAEYDNDNEEKNFAPEKFGDYGGHGCVTIWISEMPDDMMTWGWDHAGTLGYQLLDHPRAKAVIAEHFANSRDPALRAFAALHDQLPASCFIELLIDPDFHVRAFSQFRNAKENEERIAQAPH